MPNPALLIIVVLVVLFLLWMWKGSQASEKLRESLFRNTGLPYRNLIGLALGFIAAVLLLYSGVLTLYGAAIFFVVLVIFTMTILVWARPYQEKVVDRFAWGLLVIIILGFGLGTLQYQTRHFWVWLWHQYLRIYMPHDIILESLFLLGVILGFFVVRNWAKEQADFLSSLSAVLGGAFIATILGKLQEGNPPAITPMRAFAYYALGFTMSGSINLIVAARLTSLYTNKRSISSRAMLDFLYGSERTKLIDGYFLQNFKDDPDYARARLTDALVEYRKLIAREFAERLQKKMKLREQQAFSPPDGQLYFYELIAIESDPEQSPPDPTIPDKDRPHNVVFRRLSSGTFPLSEDEVPSGIHEHMFRVGVAARWQDTLEYISAPGEYRVAFPFQQSVSGLALLFQQTIVMDRDKFKRFRNKDHTDGISPHDIEQSRGLDEIDFLSYVAVPIVGHFNGTIENQLGVVTIDSKLFIAPDALPNKEVVNAAEGVFRARLTPNELTGYASRLYDPEDADVRYIEKVTKIIVPVMELYAKCRVGAT
jgi:hypothetical protein